jgi:hypothetical protein
MVKYQPKGVSTPLSLAIIWNGEFSKFGLKRFSKEPFSKMSLYHACIKFKDYMILKVLAEEMIWKKIKM